MMHRFTVNVSCLIFLMATVVPASCEETSQPEDKIKTPVEVAQLIVTVVDEDNKPIEGVSIMPYGCRCLEEPGTGWFWPAENMGKPKKHVSDAAGKTVVDYPVKFGSSPDWQTLSEISAEVTHPLFISQTMTLDPRIGKSQLVLKAGCRLTFSATDHRGAPTEFGVLIAGPGSNAAWVVDESGARYSRAIPDGSWQAMLVKPQDDGLHRFSGLLPVRLRDSQDITIRNVRVTPGIRLAGRLDDSVPRPVTGGKIVANCLPKPEGETHVDKNPSICWMAHTEIQEDGSFEFPSLPRTGMIQLITICNGYVGANVGMDDPDGGFTRGLHLQLADLTDFENVEIPMKPTGTVVVKVLDPDGKPLAGAFVASNPNQLLHLSGSNILGEAWDSADIIRAQFQPDLKFEYPDFRETRYFKTTDENGIATIADLPLGPSHSIHVGHEDYVMPTTGGRQGREANVDLIDSKPVDVTVRLVSKATAEATKGLTDAAEALKGLIKDTIGQ